MDSVADHPDGWGFPIRKSSDQSVLATPRSLSQPATSFIASQCQGIRQTPFLCLISRFVSEATILRSPHSARSVQGTTPARNGLDLPIPATLPRRQSAELDFQTSSSDKRCQRTNATLDTARKLHAARSDARGMMVEADGIEPTTSCLQSRRSPN